MYDWFMGIGLFNPVLLWTAFLLSAALVVYLLARRPTVRRVLLALVGILGGACVALVAVVVINATGAIGRSLEPFVIIWAACGLAAVGLAIVNLIGSRWWRKVIAAIAIVVLLATTFLGINLGYGLNATVGSFFGVVPSNPADLPKPKPTTSYDESKPLYEQWTPPADMPAVGKRETVSIPNTQSKFVAREAGIYRPPAALVADPPPLPLVILMMGQPGNPDVQYIADVLDQYAAAHQGLAPIAVIADQIGDPSQDPVCIDSTQFGGAETYITKDVVDWAKENLQVAKDPSQWVVAGYSNGGGCAFKYAAEHPEIWGNLISASGEIYPGSENPQGVIDSLFGGDKAAFEKTKPISILQSGAYQYPDTWAVFTAGDQDPGYVSQAADMNAAALAAGWTSQDFTLPDTGHGADALTNGLTKGFEILYPHLGLAPPS